jgi:hypothetical protein
LSVEKMELMFMNDPQEAPLDPEAEIPGESSVTAEAPAALPPGEVPQDPAMLPPPPPPVSQLMAQMAAEAAATESAVEETEVVGLPAPAESPLAADDETAVR